MAQEFDRLTGILSHGFDSLIDVRSPAEFAEDHIPGAINLPALDNEERALVGTIYVQDNAFRARKIGAALVARNVAQHLEGPLADMDGGWRPLVYCWRGGQRSGSFASILSQIGWRADTISGGYRSYRRLVAAAMHDTPLPHRLILLDGNTGTAKTDILALLADRGFQIVDLEGLAKHRGSVFGHRDDPQPSQKAFEGVLAAVFNRLDPGRPVIVEAESSKIGARQIPPSVWAAMRAAPRLQIIAPLAARAEYLTRAYADLLSDRENLKNTIGSLRHLQSGEVVERWQAMVDSADFISLAGELMQRHYDPRYGKSRGRDPITYLGKIHAESLKLDALGSVADRITEVLLANETASEA